MESSVRMRRCERCKKRKKKCDQAPSCSRCTRLGVQCVRERFKFVPLRTAKARRTDNEASNFIPADIVVSMPPILSQKPNQLRLAFIKMIEHDDPRYDINLVTSLLDQLPKRFGSNLALDSAANALVHGYAAIRAGAPSITAMESYALALRDLRICFDSSVLAGSVETLCAIYLIISVHILMGNQFAAVHGEGLAHILSTRGVTPAEQADEFTTQLLIIMSGQIVSIQTELEDEHLTRQQIFEAIVNPRIRVPAQMTQLLTKRDETMPLHSIRLTQHARLREYINDPTTHASELIASYRVTFGEIAVLQKRRRLLDPAFPAKDRAIFYIAYSCALSYSIVLSTIMLRHLFGPVNQLTEESEFLMAEILELIDAAAVFIPLGSSAMSTLLLAAWPNDIAKRSEIERWLDIYQGGFPIVRWLESARWLDEMLLPSTPTLDACENIQKSERPADACSVM